jgi:hypothetical protein
MPKFTFDKEQATKADVGTSISTSGNYVGKIVKAVYFKKDTGSGGIEFTFESDDGRKCDYIRIYTKNKDGSPNFALAKIHALMGLLKLADLPAVTEGDRYAFPVLNGKRIALQLQRREYAKADGRVGYTMECLHFCDYETHLTYRETIDGSAPIVWGFVPEDEKVTAGKAPESKSDDFFGGVKGNSDALGASDVADVGEDGMPF